MRLVCASIGLSMVCSLNATAMAQERGGAQPPTPAVSAPTLIRVDGQLRTVAGEPRSGAVTIAVSLYAEKDDATPLWIERQVVTLDAAGRYTLFAGTTLPDGVPQEFLSGSTPGRWLGVGVEGEAEQFRMMLVTVPYALKAREADTLAGKAASDFVLSENLGDTVKAALKSDLAKGGSSASGGGPGTFFTTDVLMKDNGSGTAIDSIGIYESGGNLGIGTPAPLTRRGIERSPPGFSRPTATRARSAA